MAQNAGIAFLVLKYHRQHALRPPPQTMFVHMPMTADLAFIKVKYSIIVSG